MNVLLGPVHPPAGAGDRRQLGPGCAGRVRADPPACAGAPQLRGAAGVGGHRLPRGLGGTSRAAGDDAGRASVVHGGGRGRARFDLRAGVVERAGDVRRRRRPARRGERGAGEGRRDLEPVAARSRTARRHAVERGCRAGALPRARLRHRVSPGADGVGPADHPSAPCDTARGRGCADPGRAALRDADRARPAAAGRARRDGGRGLARARSAERGGALRRDRDRGPPGPVARQHDRGDTGGVQLLGAARGAGLVAANAGRRRRAGRPARRADRCPHRWPRRRRAVRAAPGRRERARRRARGAGRTPGRAVGPPAGCRPGPGLRQQHVRSELGGRRDQRHSASGGAGHGGDSPVPRFRTRGLHHASDDSPLAGRHARLLAGDGLQSEHLLLARHGAGRRAGGGRCHRGRGERPAAHPGRPATGGRRFHRIARNRLRHRGHDRHGGGRLRADRPDAGPDRFAVPGVRLHPRGGCGHLRLHFAHPVAHDVLALAPAGGPLRTPHGGRVRARRRRLRARAGRAAAAPLAGASARGGAGSRGRFGGAAASCRDRADGGPRLHLRPIPRDAGRELCDDGSAGAGRERGVRTRCRSANRRWS